MFQRAKVSENSTGSGCKVRKSTSNLQKKKKKRVEGKEKNAVMGY